MGLAEDPAREEGDGQSKTRASRGHQVLSDSAGNSLAPQESVSGIVARPKPQADAWWHIGARSGPVKGSIPSSAIPMVEGEAGGTFVP